MLSAAPVRIVSWNMESMEKSADKNASVESRINSAAYALRRLKPDVLLLQEVPDWKTAANVASLIDVRFAVRICSAYTGSSTNERSAKQMAVISRFGSSVTWYERWQGAGDTNELGYAFALLDIDGSKVGFASLELPDSDAAGQSAIRLAAAGQFFSKLSEIRSWKDNRPSAFFFGGTLGIGEETSDAVLTRAREEGFVSAFLNLAKDARVTRRGHDDLPAATTDYIYGEGGGYVAPVELIPNIISDHSMLAVDWDPQRSMPVIMVSDPALAQSSGAPAPGSGESASDGSKVQASIELFGVDLKWWVLGLGGSVLLLIILMLRRPAHRAFDPSHALPSSSGGKILFLSDNEGNRGEGHRDPLLSDAERRHVRPHLLRWLKEAFIGGLLRQRREMIHTQDMAARQADELGRRMEQIQDKLIDRIHKAERRVAELEQELAVAKSENRELIESNLLLAQRELAEARAKVVAQSGRA